MRVYFAKDDNDDSGDDYLGYYSGETATAAYRPQLVVTYRQDSPGDFSSGVHFAGGCVTVHSPCKKGGRRISGVCLEPDRSKSPLPPFAKGRTEWLPGCSVQFRSGQCDRRMQECGIGRKGR